MGRRKEMPKQPKMREYYIWWGTDTEYPMGATIEATSKEDALNQAKETAQVCNSKKYGVKKMTARQLKNLVTRVCPSSAHAPAW